MATRLPRRSAPGYLTVGANQAVIATGWYTAADMNLPLGVLVAGNTNTSDPLLVAGFDSFMIFANYAGGGGTTTWEYNLLDPQTQALLITRTISAATAPGVLILTFGAQSATAPAATRGDIFHLIQLRVTANAANQTYTDIQLMCGVR